MAQWKKGENPNHRKFTDEQITQMFLLNAQGVTMAETAKRFNSHMSTISNILKRKTYTHVPIPDGVRIVIRRGSKHPSSNRSLTPDQVREMRRLASQGLTIKVIAERMGLSNDSVGLAVRRRTYKDVPDEPDQSGPAI